MPKKSAVEKGYEVITDCKWWKEVVVYLVYTRWFKDRDGDGVGGLIIC